MGSRLGRRVVNFANLPIKLLMPSSFTNIQEIALKTIPSASKIEIKRVLESLYGFEVEKVRTLNMEGKKKKRGGVLIAKPDYKKAYVTLKSPLSISTDLYPIGVIEEDKRNMIKESKSKSKSKSSIVEEGEVRSHWLDGSGNRDGNGGARFRPERSSGGSRGGWGEDRRGVRGGGGDVGAVKFPWSSMRTSR
ncbi:ribosomal protein L23/L15e family protein [Actinidia rufa]|uniref:Large ribosomal subunit protein uL23m n=1 Tax=Actinidia rufa TaxID=165716 RepID=A0A7J0E167_9ERIC|nr:ribosomal protein L23/L15e family protein [Actinidia rufa]